MKRTDAEKTKEALTEALAGLKSCYESGCTYNRTRTYIADVMTRVAAILAPDPIETEDVTLELWVCPTCDKVYHHAATLCICHTAGDNIRERTPAKFTSTITREKKQPVVKSQEFRVEQGRHCPYINLPESLKASSAVVTWEEPAA
jgi:hypothetical protein